MMMMLSRLRDLHVCGSLETFNVIEFHFYECIDFYFGALMMKFLFLNNVNFY